MNNTIADAIYKHYESQEEKPRPHMGCSLIGHECDRFLWLSFRWAFANKHDGRILKLFKRGHDEEDRVIADLEAVGYKVTDRQKRVEFRAMVSGSIDGIIHINGVQHLLEIKTHSRRSFDDLEKNGVRKSKPMHYTQMQAYMYGLGLTKVLYYAVCKDDDRIYTEVIEINHGFCCDIIERAESIATCNFLPKGVSENPTWHVCKMCPAHTFCHKTKESDQVNCRTCRFCELDEGFCSAETSMRCVRWDKPIPLDFQYEGCKYHDFHGDLKNA